MPCGPSVLHRLAAPIVSVKVPSKTIQRTLRYRLKPTECSRGSGCCPCDPPWSLFYQCSAPACRTPRLASPRLASPRLASPRLALPCLASPRLALPCLALPCLALLLWWLKLQPWWPSVLLWWLILLPWWFWLLSQ